MPSTTLHIRTFLVFGLMCCTLGAGIFAQAVQGIPDWYPDPKAAYPESSFLAALGEGSDETLARNAAMEQIARYFGVDVQTVTTGSETYREKAGAQASSSLESVISTKVRASASHRIFNLETTPLWRTPKGGFAVVAYVNKAAALQSWAGIETALIQRGNACLDRTRSEESGMGLRLSNYLAAGEFLRQARSMETMRRLLDSTAGSAGNDALARDYGDLKSTFLPRCAIQLDPRGDETVALVPLVESELSRNGFLTAAASTAAAGNGSAAGGLRMTLRYGTKKLAASYGLGGCQWNLDLSLQDGLTTLVAVSLQGKATASSLEKAQEKALDAATAQTRDKFIPDLLTRMAALVE